MPNPPTCKHCYWFKLRWKDGDGVCWKTDGTPRHAEQETCEHYEAKVIVVTRSSEASA